MVTALTADLVNNLDVQIGGTLGPLLDGIVDTLVGRPGLAAGERCNHADRRTIAHRRGRSLAGPARCGDWRGGRGGRSGGTRRAAPDREPPILPTRPWTLRSLSPSSITTHGLPGDTPHGQLGDARGERHGGDQRGRHGDVHAPNAGFVGTDTFTHTATNGTLISNTTTVSINVLGPGQQSADGRE